MAVNVQHLIKITSLVKKQFCNPKLMGQGESTETINQGVSSLVDQWLRLHTSTARDADSISGWGTGIARPGHKGKYIERENKLFK